MPAETLTIGKLGLLSLAILTLPQAFALPTTQVFPSVSSAVSTALPSSTVPSSTALPSSTATLTNFTCPASNNAVYRSSANFNYRLGCDADFKGKSLGWSQGSGLSACITKCEAVSGCLAVTYAPGLHACYFKGSDATYVYARGAQGAMRGILAGGKPFHNVTSVTNTQTSAFSSKAIQASSWISTATPLPPSTSNTTSPLNSLSAISGSSSSVPNPSGTSSSFTSAVSTMAPNSLLASTSSFITSLLSPSSTSSSTSTLGPASSFAVPPTATMSISSPSSPMTVSTTSPRASSTILSSTSTTTSTTTSTQAASTSSSFVTFVQSFSSSSSLITVSTAPSPTTAFTTSTIVLPVTSTWLSPPDPSSISPPRETSDSSSSSSSIVSSPLPSSIALSPSSSTASSVSSSTASSASTLIISSASLYTTSFGVPSTIIMTTSFTSPPQSITSGTTVTTITTSSGQSFTAFTSNSTNYPPNPSSSGSMSIPTSTYPWSNTSSALQTLPTLSILPLGDSITWGYLANGPMNGYRLNLINLLTGTSPLYSCNQTVSSSGMFQNVTSLGSQQDGNFTQNFNEGHPAARIDQIQANFTQSLPAYPNAANLVFLMAGINDVALNYSLATAPQRLGGLIDLLFTTYPTVTVIIALCSPVTYPPWDQARQQYNAAIPAIVQARVDQGKHLVMVDMSAVITTADLADLVHPTEGGYMKMAYEWFRGVNIARSNGWL